MKGSECKCYTTIRRHIHDPILSFRKSCSSRLVIPDCMDYNRQTGPVAENWSSREPDWSSCELEKDGGCKMNLDDLKRRIEKWEDVHTEFKEWPINNVSCAQSLVAFANTDGGQFVIGVSNDKQLVGVADPDRVMQWIDNIAYNNCEPPITVIQETVKSEEGRVAVVVNVPKGDQRPYRTNQGDYTIRTTSGKRLASRQELLRLFQASETLFYDETILTKLH